ncbi:polygalacturonase-like [Spinacia oleracea]|uniref:Polygalacturonase-like n=1 Tax=Spinacia oleracea TaxID=3562 RepID=A0A9R0HXW2_SPIOL|nr:polygalacturonase-like [Spinacia oleracea]
MKQIIIALLSFILVILVRTSLATTKYILAKGGNYYDIVALGAKPDPNIDSSNALKVAWKSACGSLGRSTIFIPQGRFLVRNAIKFSGKGCQTSGITFIIKGTIAAPKDFRVLGNSKTWVLFEDAYDVTISGGVFDGEGAGLWDCKRFGKGSCPRGVTTLGFINSMNIIVNGVTSLNSQLFHMVFNGCKNVKVQGAKISASGDSPNTDGIHVQKSTGVTILNSHIATGDDCISIGPGATNLWIQEITCGPGHGISIGSLGKELNEAGVQNVTVKMTTFTNTQNGVRIKSWGRPSSGYVRNIVFQQLTMVHAQNPIIIDQNYCPSHKGCPNKVSGVRVSNVTYKDIRGSSATPIAVKLDCSSKYHCSGITMEDINLSHNNKPSSSSCTNSVGTTFGVVQPNGCL